MDRFHRTVPKIPGNFFVLDLYICVCVYFVICCHQKSKYCFHCQMLLFSLPFDSVEELPLNIYKKRHWWLECCFFNSRKLGKQGTSVSSWVVSSRRCEEFQWNFKTLLHFNKATFSFCVSTISSNLQIRT